MDLVPCWEYLGNSYWVNAKRFTLMAGAGLGPATAHFSLGPWGHRRSQIPSADRVVLVAEPRLVNQVEAILYGYEIGTAYTGWHGEPLIDNVLYVDGSARATSAEGATHDLSARPPPTGPLPPTIYPPCANCASALDSGPTFQLDCYPLPGAIIWGDWSAYLNSYPDCWPWAEAANNLTP